ncbi:MAG: helix-turn-helix domain-containing protein [Candidatus Omnitrophica bacterium]|nr:helix-turn-helix domain-containing protein [Candidatus Omnitrophota bacterium]
MTNEQFITVRETAQVLGISEKKVMDLIETQKLQAYRIADQFLRLKKSEVLAVRKSGDVENENVKFEYTGGERLFDFFYFNDFYIVSLLIIVALLSIIFFF